MSGAAPSGALEIELPGWVNEVVDWSSGYPDDEARMVAVGVNCVERLGNAMLHGEVVALMFAQRRVGSFTLGGPAALAFDEGPVFPESYAYLERRGLAVERGVLRAEAVAVLSLYRERGGLIYNR